jgi:hypothetical protein
MSGKDSKSINEGEMVLVGALTVAGCPALIALYALARGARTLAIVYGSIALGMAFPAAYLILPAIATN